MPSVQEFGSRRLMANPRTGDKCANATAAMRDRARRSMPFPSPRHDGGASSIQYPACCGVDQRTSAGAGHRARREARPDAAAMQRSLRSLRLIGRGLLAFRHELLALLAVDALGIGVLRAFKRGR